MKILQLVDTLEIGGTERMCVNIANTLSAHHIENLIVVTRPPYRLLNKLNQSTKVYQGNKRNRWDFLTFIKILRFVKQNNPNVLHAHSTTLFWAVLLKLCSPGLKLIWHDHYGNRKSDSDNWIYKLFSIFMYATIAVNQDLTQWHKDHLSVNNKKIACLNNFPLIEELDLSTRTPNTILLSASLLPVKNQLDLIDAIYLLKQKHIVVTCYLAGKEADSGYTSLIKDKINALHLNDTVIVLGQTEQIETYLAKATLGVLISSSEGLPVSLLEYGLAGLQVICTPVGECGIVLEQGKYGSLVPVNDSITLSNKIQELLLDPGKMARTGAAFKSHIETTYSADNFFEKYALLLDLTQSPISSLH